MNATLEHFYDYADRDFEGDSFNGTSLIATLRSLSPEAAAFTGTTEGYSAWTVALHVAYFKHFIARALLGEAKVGAYPYDGGKDGFGKPGEASAAAWEGLIAYLRSTHAQAAAAIRGLEPARLADTMPEWKLPWGRVIAWYLGHDGFHVAQIRSMGVPGLIERFSP